MDCAIQFNNVTASYGSKTALREITLGVPAKQIFGIIGPANSGKTTLLKCINRTLEFTPSARRQRPGRGGRAGCGRLPQRV